MITRRGQSAFFYRYARENGQVRRVYAACGEEALEAQARIDEARRLQQEERERERMDERLHAEALAPLERLSELIDAVVKEALEARGFRLHARGDRKSTRLNSSH